MSPPARAASKPSTRLDEKQGRAFGAAGPVCIVSDYGVLATCHAADPCLQRYLDARNAEAIRTHRGKLVAIKLHSIASDHGHLGEHWGNSNITTLEEQLECGPLLQHKPSGRYRSPRHKQ